MSSSPPPSLPNFTSHYKIPYSPLTTLNTLDIHLPTHPTPPHPSKTLIYIHGGAYRDPLQTSLTLLPALPLLPPDFKAIASLNYRLSPHPAYPPLHAADAAARSARWPDHLDDVCAAVAWLGSEGGGGRWGWPGCSGGVVLAGHSVGGTMAFRAAARLARLGLGVEAVVSVAGIADFGVLRDKHLGAREVYEGFITAALGEEGVGWDEGMALREGMPGVVRVVVLGQGRGDQLVEWGQVELLEGGVEREREKGWDGRVRVVELEGGHEVWEEGKEVARCVKVAVEMLGEEKSGGTVENLV